MKVKNKLFFIFLIIVLFVIMPFDASEIKAGALTESEFSSKIAYLKTIYKDKEYWNNYNAIGYDGTGSLKCKCSTSCAASCTCYCGKFYLNGVYYGAQCYGFANKMGYLVFGSVPTASWTKYTSVSNYYAGDYVRVKNDRHSIFITKVSGDTITYVDCNNYGACQVKWERTITKNSLSSITTYVYHLSGNALTGTGVPSSTTTPENVIWTQNNSYPTPITAYPAATSGKITVYNSALTAYSQSTRYIAYNDLCTINAVYTNGYCSVTYPTANGTNTEYAKLSDFIPNAVTPYAYTPTTNLTTYVHSDMSTTFGSVFTTDRCTVVEKSGNKLHLIYPVSGGYKLGWITVQPEPEPSDFPTPLYGYNSSSTERTTVYESVSTMGTYYGQIFVDDACTLNAVNVSGGWIQVTYPVGATTKTGYVYLDQFVPSASRLTTFYTTTVTSQTTTYRKADMGTSYGYVSVGDSITVVGKSGNKLQVIYPVDSGGYKIAWIYDNYVKKNLSSISVTSNPTKTNYLEGQSFDKSGLVITAKYDDGSTANVTNSCTLSGYTNTVGVKTINVSYAGKQTAFTVTVKSKSPTGIKITSNPAKTSYYVGDAINLTGLVVQATYDNGTTAVIEDYDVDGSGLTNIEGNKSVTVSYIYNEIVKTAVFDIVVVKPSIKLLEPSLVMNEGDEKTVTSTVIPSTQAVTWESSNTSVATVSGGKIVGVSNGTATVTASFIYNEISYSAQTLVIVGEKEKPVILESVAVNTSPMKTTYKVGEELDTTGLSLKIIYSDGSSINVSDGYTARGFSSNTAGKKTVIVSYEGKETEFTVTVNEENMSKPQIVVEAQTVQAGDIVEVPILLKNNPGIIGFRINVAYDSDVLTLENASEVDFAEVSFGPLENNPISVLWCDAIHGDNKINGTIANLTFKVNEDVFAGESIIKVSYDDDDIFNSNLNNVNFETIDGVIHIDEKEISERWLYDHENHWKVTANDVVVQKETHRGGIANCHSKAICEICGAEYGDKNLQNHDGGVVIRNDLLATKETEGYTGDTYCIGCNTKIAQGEVIQKKNSANSTSQEPEIPYSAPIEIPTLKASASHNKVKLSWNAESDIDGYYIYRSTNSSGYYSEIKKIEGQVVYSYTDTAVVSGKTYYYKIRTYRVVSGEEKVGDYSNTVRVQITPDKVNLTSVKAGKRKATVIWKKVSGASGYEVYMSTKETKGYKKVKTLTKVSKVKYIKKGLKTKKTYYFKVRAYKIVSGKKVYGSYSTPNKVKVK